MARFKASSTFFPIAASLTAAFLISSCASVRPSGDKGDTGRLSSNGSPRTVDEVIQRSNLGQSSSSFANLGRKIEYGEIIVQGKRLKNTTFDIPITINSRVDYWVDYFTGRGRKYFQTYLERAEYFIPYMQPILKQNGIPEDFVYLAMIESGFNNFARSQARAVGPWQFISATGKRYGLMVNWWVDERRDIRKSTIGRRGLFERTSRHVRKL